MIFNRNPKPQIDFQNEKLNRKFHIFCQVPSETFYYNLVNYRWDEVLSVQVELNNFNIQQQRDLGKAAEGL